MWGVIVNPAAGPAWAGQCRRPVPGEHQQRVLTFGIIAALALRAVFIALGATLLSLLSFMFLLFGLLLIWTAVRLYRHRDEDPDVTNNALVRMSRRILPVSDTYTDGRLISRAGRRRGGRSPLAGAPRR